MQRTPMGFGCWGYGVSQCLSASVNFQLKNMLAIWVQVIDQLAVVCRRAHVYMQKR
jgi:hypothetical protein